MSMQEYKDFNFKPETYKLISLINSIIDTYIADGYKLTVRQLYYQLVARDIIPNNEKSYKRITGVVNDGRLAGLIDWDVIEDRTREFIRRNHWNSGQEILDNSAKYFHMDMWETQPNRVFVIVEKEALVGVLESTCYRYDVPLLAARGYPSVSVLREFVEEDILPYAEDQDITILHLGDHDPSGLDMTRDLEERVALFAGDYSWKVELRRLALNMQQIHEQKPPPNPAKTTDARFKAYQDQYGDKSWELDALNPAYLNRLITSNITGAIDDDAWAERKAEIEDIKTRIAKVAKEFA